MSPILAAVLFASTFNTPAQNPICEGTPCKWYHTDNQWFDVRKAAGIAFATAVNLGYDDSYALLTDAASAIGTWPSNLTVTAKVYRAVDADCSAARDVELLLRMADTASTVRGYECYFSCTASNPKAAIVRWNGALGDFQEIGTSTSGINLQTGDIVKAVIDGNHIRTYINDVLVAEAFDSTFADGNPGMGFFWRGSGTASQFALTNYLVTSP